MLASNFSTATMWQPIFTKQFHSKYLTKYLTHKKGKRNFLAHSTDCKKSCLSEDWDVEL